MGIKPENPIVVQSNGDILLEERNPQYEDARDALAKFAELVKCPEYFHTYRITPLSLWNAASAGHTADEIIVDLEKYSKYDIPQNITHDIRDQTSRFGRLKLSKEEGTGRLILLADDPNLILQIINTRGMEDYIEERMDEKRLIVKSDMRGRIKQALIKIGFPVEDLAGYVEGMPLDVEMRPIALSGKPFSLRDYQRDGVEIFHAAGHSRGGSGVLVLPCGAGKTVIGIGVMAKLKQHTLILSTNITALRQWKAELLDKTTLMSDQIGEYSGDVKEAERERQRDRPVVITTYQMMTWRKTRTSPFEHMALFQHGRWGLIIYDEVHLLPAPVFRAVAEIQGKRRLGLTATLVREDEKEDDVFSLIGPKKYDAPWKKLEGQGWIATASCYEIRVALPEELRSKYAVADTKVKYRIASENPRKFDLVQTLIEKHKGDNILIIGQYLDQLHSLQERFKGPIITGKTPNDEREKLYGDFKSGRQKILIVSKVANFAVDLPDASVAIQISGTFGSRQEEAQRLGRLLRPKAEGNMAHFYSLVTKDSKDQDFAQNRQRFLTEQGYRYEIQTILDEAGGPGVKSSANGEGPKGKKQGTKS
ncbi:MAG: helicase-associated domain-containing protein [Candidatus Sumerlaeota bacterium]|nr:helicase-associated domain-containing protein [Candidatus Sumerlaeota bacterium]